MYPSSAVSKFSGMAELPATGLLENKKQCLNEPSTNHPLLQTTTKTVDEDSVLPNQTPANETKERRSIELVPFLLLASHTDIVNSTQSILTFITQRYQTGLRRHQSINWDNLVKIHVSTPINSYTANLSRDKPTSKLPGFYLLLSYLKWTNCLFY